MSGAAFTPVRSVVWAGSFSCGGANSAAGFPFVITGVIEAEQFDKGGKGIAYTNVMNNVWTNDYRASQIEITNCTDKGLGYCEGTVDTRIWHPVFYRPSGTRLSSCLNPALKRRAIFARPSGTNGRSNFPKALLSTASVTNFPDYGYDKIGQLKSVVGKNSDHGSRAT